MQRLEGRGVEPELAAEEESEEANAPRVPHGW